MKLANEFRRECGAATRSADERIELPDVERIVIERSFPLSRSGTGCIASRKFVGRSPKLFSDLRRVSCGAWLRRQQATLPSLGEQILHPLVNCLSMVLASFGVGENASSAVERP
ncbi:MAG: hypothetical protein IPN24_13985 [Betaproteobacteria bacterium]|nr:hypothetical protein [Betaproteobacteria bacterium]